ncbi:metal/formaldehyde-sensitive transcriptional repressor [Stenotrophomonas sp. HITSZ_GD]|uniref:metal/formaldehyde-sensitive transcriptional repressor n=1 Tax=Stenotrophomonas sp. HITSZ_GD TaxID=3037248 RepID=UPI00240E7215|nr:metal/formaldehyde-sensitive transcriptional repressor [Stenotrophomonas sp. HITSZ_GD]MDG2524165.1 metal/formaldehyde-sensitive transcriptional repressor [Stenotrophomonas sp. HITSZ_GD]
MSHVSHNKKALLARLRRIAGQVAGLEKALQEDADCSDVLVQIAAAKGAMHALMMEVLVGHLGEHVVAEPDEAQRQREAEVLVSLLKGFGK